MKTLKTLLTVFAVVGFSTVAFAQTSITASANVISSATVTAGNDLDFGSLTTGDNPTVTLADGNTAQAGWSITGLGTSNFVMTISADSLQSTGLVSGANGNALDEYIAFDGLSAYYTETEGDAASGGSGFTGDETGLTLDAAATANDAWVYVGGSLEAITANNMGLYTGSVTLTVYFD